MGEPGGRQVVTFYFDPGCPWTWMTSRWLVAAAEERALDIRWRTFSLGLLNQGRQLPASLDTPEHRAKAALTARALRVTQAARAQDDDDAAGRFYREWGVRFHETGREPTAALLEEAAAAAGVTDLLRTADTADLDAAVADSLAEALRLAGPDVGSPVLHLAGSERGMFGPIVSPAPTGPAAGQLWDALVVLQGLESFYELKRGRLGPPVFASP
ncbi:MAG: DsbA family protein [Acidimicrobiales bacterium]